MAAAIVMLVAVAIGSVGYFRESSGPESPDLFGNDYLAFYAAGRLALDGRPAAAYDHNAHMQEQSAVAAEAKGGGSVANTYYFGYPPTYLLLVAAFAALPYYASLFLFLAATATLYAFALWRIWPGWRTIVYALAVPNACIAFGFGQNGFLTAGLVGLALVLLDRRPWLAGILLGFLATKPQLGLAFPVVLIAILRWRVIVAACLTVGVTCAASVAIFGLDTWRAFFAIGEATRSGLLEQNGVGFDKLQSLFAFLRLVGASLQIAYTAQAMLALAVAVILALLWRGPADYRLKAAAAATGTLLMTPFCLSYDLLIEVPAVAFFLSYGRERGFRSGELVLIAAALISPEIAATGMIGNGPWGLVGMAALFLLIGARAMADAASTITRATPGALDRRPAGS